MPILHIKSTGTSKQDTNWIRWASQDERTALWPCIWRVDILCSFPIGLGDLICHITRSHWGMKKNATNAPDATICNFTDKYAQQFKTRRQTWFEWYINTSTQHMQHQRNKEARKNVWNYNYSAVVSFFLIWVLYKWWPCTQHTAHL